MSLLRHCLAATLAALMLALAPAAARTEEGVWQPLPVGLTLVYDFATAGAAFTITQVVTDSRGDEVTVQSETTGFRQTERYFRYLLSIESTGNSFDFDRAEVARLWPLAAGRSVATTVQGTVGGQPMTFDYRATVEAVEEITVPAGGFRAARVAYSLVAPGQLSLVGTTWLEIGRGVPVRSEIAIAATGYPPQSVVLALRELR